MFLKVHPTGHQLDTGSSRKGSRLSKFEKHWAGHRPTSRPWVPLGSAAPAAAATAAPRLVCPGAGQDQLSSLISKDRWRSSSHRSHDAGSDPARPAGGRTGGQADRRTGGQTDRWRVQSPPSHALPITRPTHFRESEGAKRTKMSWPAPRLRGVGQVSPRSPSWAPTPPPAPGPPARPRPRLPLASTDLSVVELHSLAFVVSLFKGADRHFTIRGGLRATRTSDLREVPARDLTEREGGRASLLGFEARPWEPATWKGGF